MNDRARVTIRVEVPRPLACQLFTAEIDGWWRHGRKYRLWEPSTIALEPHLGGRLTETARGPGAAQAREIGVVTAWEPPCRLLLSWRAANFEPSDPSTEVEVTFERAIGPLGEATLVTLEHRGWQHVRPDHPVRHGEAPAAFLRGLGLYWSDQLASLRERALSPQSSR